MLQLNPFRAGRWLIAATLGICLSACTPTSEEKLSASEAGGEALLGAWFGGIADYDVYVHVVEDSGSALKVLLIAHDAGDDTGWTSANAYPAVIDGTGYISIQFSESFGQPIGTDEYVILRYRTGRGYVEFYGMDPDALSAALGKKIDGEKAPGGRMHLTASGAELVRFIEDNGGAELFNDQVGYLERVSEDEIPSVNVRTPNR